MTHRPTPTSATSDRTMTTSPRRIVLGGAMTDLMSQQQLWNDIGAALHGDGRRAVFLASMNLDHVHRFGHGSADAGLIRPTTEGPRWIVLLDGVPLVWYARQLTGTSWPQLAGSDLLPQLIGFAGRHGANVGFFGGTPRSARRSTERTAGTASTAGSGRVLGASANEVAGPRRILRTGTVSQAPGRSPAGRWPRKAVAGTLVGSIRRGDRSAGCSVLRGSGRLMSGRIARAPTWIRKVGLESAFRLAKEPKRLARRYLVEGPVAGRRVLTCSSTGVDGLRASMPDASAVSGRAVRRT